MSNEAYSDPSEASSGVELHELEKCANVLSRVNGNLRLAATQLDNMIVTVTETNEVASGWIELWRRVRGSSIE